MSRRKGQKMATCFDGKTYTVRRTNGHTVGARDNQYAGEGSNPGAPRYISCGTPKEMYERVEPGGPKVCADCYKLKDKPRKCGKCSITFVPGCAFRFHCPTCAIKNALERDWLMTTHIVRSSGATG